MAAANGSGQGGSGRGGATNLGGGNDGQDRRKTPLDTSLLLGCASLLDQIDKKVLVLLRDRRTLIGILRTCDQFNNLVLHNSVERITVGNKYGDIQRGVFLIRGDNVVLVGEIDPAKENNPMLEKVEVEEILAAQQAEQEEKTIRDAKRTQGLKDRGLVYVPPDREIGGGGDEF
jgi:U6 snRNA-associated Sm-like protein LSm1